ncbi:MAG: ABC transporter permease [Lachnospiraceae bacterium]|nr:ABC transporter permease [Lachnospiraceae bacterium]
MVAARNTAENIRAPFRSNFIEVAGTEERELAKQILKLNEHRRSNTEKTNGNPVVWKILKSGVVSWIILFVVWIVASKLNDPDFLPSPAATLEGFTEIVKSGVLWQDIKVSMIRVFFGWTRGLLFAIPVGLLIGQFKPVRAVIEPLISFFRFVPAIGFLTLFLMWFGVGEGSKLALITYAVVFPVIVNTIAGVSGIDPVKYQAAESLGATRVRTFFTVTVPGAVPGILTGVRLGLSGAIISIVAAEMLAANEGLGYLIYTSRLYYRTDWIFVGIFILGIIGFVADKLIRYIAYRLFRFYGVTR